MSEPFSPQNHPPQRDPASAERSNPKRSNAWIYLAIIAILIGINIYLYLSRNDNKGEISEQNLVSNIHEVDSSKIKLQLEYNAALIRLDKLIGQNKQLDNELKKAQSELQQSKARIQQILNTDGATAGELAEAKILIRNLNTKLDSYEKQLASLRALNRKIIKERDSVVEVNTEMHHQVELGKVLHASNIRLSAINLRRRGGREVPTTRAKRADLLRVKFDIDENRIADEGNSDLNIRIIDAEENLLSNIALGSGTFTTEDGKPINYSVSKVIYLKKAEPISDIVVDWQQTAEYPKGTYRVEIYHKGYLIGKGSSILR